MSSLSNDGYRGACDGPGLRKGAHWYDRPTRYSPELTVLPDKATRWQQVLRAVEAEYQEHRYKGANPDPWTASLQRALDVDFSGRE